MKDLDIHEAADLLRTRLQALPGLKASVALIMWRGLLWALGELYPRYIICDTRPDLDAGGVPAGQPAGEEDPDWDRGTGGR